MQEWRTKRGYKYLLLQSRNELLQLGEDFGFRIHGRQELQRRIAVGYQIHTFTLALDLEENPLHGIVHTILAVGLFILIEHAPQGRCSGVGRRHRA